MTEQWGPEAHDALVLLQSSVTVLHQSIEPTAIRSNVLEVFIAVNHVLYGGEWWHGLGTEYQAWEQIDPHQGDPEWYVHARDAIAGYAWELCSHAETWLTKPTDGWDQSRDEVVGHLVQVSASVRGG